MIETHKKIIQDLRQITGNKNLLTKQWNKETYSKGWRYGSGEALAVASPGSLLEIWKLLEVCVLNDIIVVVDAAGVDVVIGIVLDASGVVDCVYCFG